MARLSRLTLPHFLHHVVLRGNNKQLCFFEHTDYLIFLKKLAEYSDKYNIQIHSYVLMPNHIHLLLTPEDSTSVSRLIQSLGRFYVKYVNKTYDRTGTLWEGRYKSTLVDSKDYYLMVSRYIETNPVRSKLVEHPSEYPWSSFKINALGFPLDLITYHDCYEALGTNEIQRQESYLALFHHSISENDIADIRNSLNKSWVLGDESFKVEVEKLTGRRVSPLKRGGDRKSKMYLSSKK